MTTDGLEDILTAARDFARQHPDERRAAITILNDAWRAGGYGRCLGVEMASELLEVVCAAMSSEAGRSSQGGTNG